MTDTFDEEMTGKECGLIKHLGKRNYQLKNEQDAHKKAVNVAMLMIYNYSSANEGEKNVLEYLRKTDTWLNAYQLTNIKEYTNKKGVVSLTHYNQNDKYVGSVKKLGETPIYVETMTEMRHDNLHLWSVVLKHRHTDEENIFVVPVKQNTRYLIKKTIKTI